MILGTDYQNESHAGYQKWKEHRGVVDVEGHDVEEIQVSVGFDTGTPARENSSGWKTEVEPIKDKEQEALQNRLKLNLNFSSWCLAFREIRIICILEHENN